MSCKWCKHFDFKGEQGVCTLENWSRPITPDRYDRGCPSRDDMRPKKGETNWDTTHGSN